MKLKTKKKLKTPKTLKFDIRAQDSLRSMNVELQGEAKITVCEAKDGVKTPPKFEMTVYAGGPISPKLDPPLKHPIVIDLSGMDLKKQSIPALKDHDPARLVGHTISIASDGKKLTASGVVSGAGADANEVVMAAGNGFKWPVSLGASLSNLDLIKAKDKTKVNGREVEGPVYIARASRSREISFLTLAADDDAEANIAASAAEGNAMNFDEWLKLKKLQRDRLSEAQIVTLQAAYETEQKHGDDAEIKRFVDATVTAIAMPATKKPKAKTHDEDNAGGNGETPSDALIELKAELTSIRRTNEVHRLCGEKNVELAAKALEKNWDDETIKVAIEAAELRAGIGSNVQIRARRPKDAPESSIVLEAAIAMAANLANIEKHFDAKALGEAAKRFPQRIGLQEAYLFAARENGYNGNGIRQDIRGVVMAACGEVSMQAAAFSTVSLPLILTSLSNKILLEGYNEIDQSWRAIASRRSVSDFKAVNSYGLNGDFVFEELPADGEIKHATVTEETFSNQARTYAKMFAITRQMIKNDDLGAMTTIPRKLGRGGGLKLNSVFWTKYLDHASFFTAGNNNYVSGAGSALSIAGLTAALTKLRRQTDPDGNPIQINGAILLVPPELEATALALNASTTINTGGAATETQVLNANIYAGRFRIVVSPYLTDTAEWYVIADPQGLPLIEVVFLDGRETPIVDQADTDFNTLGTQFRGYFDFGVSALQNTRAAVKANGT